MTNIYLDLETIPDQRPGAFDKIYDTIKPFGIYDFDNTVCVP